MDNYDEALSKYLETCEADDIFGNFVTAIRKAFIAGYKAAGGDISKDPKVIPLIREINKEVK